MSGSVRSRQPAVFRLVPDCPRSDKFLLRTRGRRGHPAECPTFYRTFLAQPGLAEASRKSLPPSLTTASCADRGQEFAPSRQRCGPTVLLLLRLGRGHRAPRRLPAPV